MAQLHASDGRHHSRLPAGDLEIVRSCFQSPARPRNTDAERALLARPSTDRLRPRRAMRSERFGFPVPEARLRAIANGDIEPIAFDHQRARRSA